MIEWQVTKVWGSKFSESVIEFDMRKTEVFFLRICTYKIYFPLGFHFNSEFLGSEILCLLKITST